jgi:uncharacterized membrane protein
MPTKVGVFSRMGFGLEALAIFIIRFVRKLIAFLEFIYYYYFLNHQKTADIAICDLTKSYKRMKAADFTIAYNTVPLTFITLKPGLKSRNWITITPFSLYVWLMVGLAFIMTDISVQLLYAKIVFTYNRIDSISISLIGALLQQCKNMTSLLICYRVFLMRILFQPI